MAWLDGRANGRGPAIVEWVNALRVCSSAIAHVGQLGDGELLLHILHDAAPCTFPGPDAVHLWRLVEGLERHFSGRGHASGEACAHALLERATAAQLEGEGEGAAALGDGDAVELAELVVLAIVESDFPERPRYIEACQGLSVDGQQAIMAIIERFREEPVDAAALGARAAGGGGRLAAPERQELARLRRDLDAERERRRAAEEAERLARLELRLAEDGRERAVLEQQALVDMRVEQEVEHYAEELRRSREELTQLRDELDVARSQAGASDRLAAQLRESRKKLEELPALKNYNEELQGRIDSLLSTGRSGGGATEHLHSRLEQLRVDAAADAAALEAAQHQVRTLTDQLAQARLQQREATGESATLRRELAAGRGAPADSSATAAAGADFFSSLAVAAKTPSEVPVPSETSLEASSVDALRQLISSQKDDLLERLLAERDRAARAEAALQAASDDRARAAERLAAFEATAAAAKAAAAAAAEEALRVAVARAAEALRAAEAAASVSQGGGTRPHTEGGERAQELQEQLAQRDRELHVHRWRAGADDSAAAAQERVMLRCFHELGLRYQRLQVHADALQERLRVAESIAA